PSARLGIPSARLGFPSAGFGFLPPGLEFLPTGLEFLPSGLEPLPCGLAERPRLGPPLVPAGGGRLGSYILGFIPERTPLVDDGLLPSRRVALHPAAALLIDVLRARHGDDVVSGVDEM